MSRRGGLFAAAAVLGALVSACSTPALSADELAVIVEDSAVAMPSGEVPDEILNLLDDYQVVIIGETHLVEEQRSLTAALLRGLHERGVRQLLLEWPHLADWVVADFVVDGPLNDGWRPPRWLYGDLLTEIRDFNRTVADGEKLEVRGIDVNLDAYGGASDFRESLRGFHRHLGGPSPIDAFLAADYSAIESQNQAVAAALRDLRSQRGTLSERWGEARFQSIVEMLEVESASILVRAETDDERSAELRETEMKRVAEVRLLEASGRTVVNVGGNHAQKERLRGTDTDWIGGYLVNQSPAVAGSAISVLVLPATLTDPAGVVDYDINDDSPSNELLRVLTESTPDQAVFLSFDNAAFSQEKVNINIEGSVVGAVLPRHWDALIVLPVGTRIPLP